MFNCLRIVAGLTLLLVRTLYIVYFFRFFSLFATLPHIPTALVKFEGVGGRFVLPLERNHTEIVVKRRCSSFQQKFKYTPAVVRSKNLSTLIIASGV